MLLVLDELFLSLGPSKVLSTIIPPIFIAVTESINQYSPVPYSF